MKKNKLQGWISLMKFRALKNGMETPIRHWNRRNKIKSTIK